VRFVLASASPRRKALLASLGLDFEVQPSGAEEVDHGSAPEALVLANARAKRDEVASTCAAPTVVIAADTLVFIDDEPLSKPHTGENARAMLRRLSGRAHTVATGVAVVRTDTGQSADGVESTQVVFRDLTDADITRFVEAVNPVDRAGGYTVDGPGSLLVAGFEGCFYNVLGLPLVRLDSLLRGIGVELHVHTHSERAVYL